MLDREASFSNKIVTGNKEIIHYNVEQYVLDKARAWLMMLPALNFNHTFYQVCFAHRWS